MTVPLKLPGFIKSLGRAIRDYPPANNVITSVVRTAIQWAPERSRHSVIAHVPRVGFASARLPDGKLLRLHCGEPETILNSLFYHGWTAEEEEVLPLWRLLASEANTILDIGAHIGHFSLVAALANPHAKIVSFEPLPRVHSLLLENLRINEVRNVDARQMALGRAVGELPFYALPAGIPSSSSLSKDFMESGGHDIVDTTVAVSTIDLQNLPNDLPVLIKMDTETTEADVLAGGKAFLGAVKPLIIVEVLDQQDVGPKIEHELRTIGVDFTAYLMTGTGPIRKSELVGDPAWRNFLLVPNDRSRLGPLARIVDEYLIGAG